LKRQADTLGRTPHPAGEHQVAGEKPNASADGRLGGRFDIIAHDEVS
jgi:hypothetical protein